MEEFKINRSVMNTDGVVGRMDYFLNSLIINVAFFVALIPFLVGSASRSDVGTGVGGFISFIFFCPIIFYGAMNSFKRLRDIRGTVKDEIGYRIGLIVAMGLPYVGVIPVLFLLFAPGKITGGEGPVQDSSGEGAIDKIANGISKMRSSTSDSEKIANLEKLYKLKESGAITDEEFNKYKEETMGKIAS